MDQAAKEVELPEPSLVIKDSVTPLEVSLVCEARVLMRCLSGKEAPLVLCAAYYAFNIKEPKGLYSCLNFLFVKILCIGLTKKFKPIDF